MKIKSQCEQYANWKTSTQWKNAGFYIINDEQFEDMFPNKNRTKPTKYFSPDNVRPMTPQEKQEWREIKNDLKYENKRWEILTNVELDNDYAALKDPDGYFRKTYKTPFDWAELGRKIKPGESGEIIPQLTRFNRKFFKIEQTEEIKSDDEKKIIMDEIIKNLEY